MTGRRRTDPGSPAADAGSRGPGGLPVRWAPLLLLAAVSWGGCQDEGSVEVVDSGLARLEADQVMVDLEHVMTHEGVRRAHLEADTAYFEDEASSVRMRHYTVDFFDGQGQRRSTLTAVEGHYDMRTGDMRAIEDVVVVDPDGAQRLTTERLLYDASRNRLTSDVDFVLVQGRDTVRGEGFVTDPGLDSLTTTRPSMVSPPEDTAGARPRPAGAPDSTGGAGEGGPGAPRR